MNRTRTIPAVSTSRSPVGGTRRGGLLYRLRGEPGPTPRWPVEPPVSLPEGRLVHVPGRGELFVRDSGGDGPPVLLLHGWMVSADLNWFPIYDPLVRAGYRVLAVDHRGHGRGMRTFVPFRLAACAEDAAALVRELGVGPVLAAGYSMGGPITQLLARDHPGTVSGMVLCATAQEWRDPRTKAFWNVMGLLRLILGAFPDNAWRWGLRAVGFPDSPVTSWYAAELTRGSARDIAEAGRELGRFDSRAWLGSVAVPAAVVVTTKDREVPAAKQRAMAAALGAPTFDVAGDHAAVTARADRFAPALIEALGAVARRHAAAA